VRVKCYVLNIRGQSAIGWIVQGVKCIPPTQKKKVSSCSWTGLNSFRKQHSQWAFVELIKNIYHILIKNSFIFLSSNKKLFYRFLFFSSHAFFFSLFHPAVQLLFLLQGTMFLSFSNTAMIWMLGFVFCWVMD
jgi:hypothetical protein